MTVNCSFQPGNPVIPGGRLGGHAFVVCSGSSHTAPVRTVALGGSDVTVSASSLQVLAGLPLSGQERLPGPLRLERLPGADLGPLTQE